MAIWHWHILLYEQGPNFTHRCVLKRSREWSLRYKLFGELVLSSKLTLMRSLGKAKAFVANTGARTVLLAIGVVLAHALYFWQLASCWHTR